MVKMSWRYQIHNINDINHSAIIWVRHSRVPDLIGLRDLSWMLELLSQFKVLLHVAENHVKM